MATGQKTFTIPCLVNWSILLKFKDGDGNYINLNTYTFDLDIKRDGTTLVSATCTPSGSSLTLSIPRASLPNTLAGWASYDLIAISGGVWQRWLEGSVEFTEGVSNGS